jgi:hypothetical protein
MKQLFAPIFTHRYHKLNFSFLKNKTNFGAWGKYYIALTFFHSSSCGQTLNSLRCLPTTPWRVAAAVADGAEWAGGEQRRVGHTHGKARSGAGREGEVSFWLCFSPVKTTCTKDSPNQRLLRATPMNPRQY